jgi:hypothetical protein
MSSSPSQEAVQEWPGITMVRFSERVRKGNDSDEVQGVWLAADPLPWDGPTGYETARYIPESAITPLVGALEEIVALGEEHAEGNFRLAFKHVAVARKALADFQKPNQGEERPDDGDR